MKRSAKPLYPQMNLSLLNEPAIATADEEQNELTMALIELLISAAEATSEQLETGEEHESKTHA